MASLCRSAAAARSIAVRSKTLLPRPKPSRITALLISRSLTSALGMGSSESLMPLHSAIASARLKSFLAVDSSCWSWLSQGNIPNSSTLLSLGNKYRRPPLFQANRATGYACSRGPVTVLYERDSAYATLMTDHAC